MEGMRTSSTTMGNAAPFYTPPLLHPVHHFGPRTIDFSRQVALMAIVNRTPDSFYDGGSTFALDAAVAASLAAVENGADWVDIGGVTTGLSNPDIARVVAEYGAHLVITHSLAAPRTVYPRPHYDDVVTEVAAFLSEKVELALSLGVPAEKIIIDPGHDLNKNTLHTLEITRRFNEIAALGFPTLAAVSNKDFIGETLNQTKSERLEGSIASGVICILGGARILRMHNVAASSSAIRMTEAVMGWRSPAYLKHNMGQINEPAHAEHTTPHNN